MRSTGLYWAVTRGSFRRFATYRVATAAGIFTNTVFGFILSYTYIALWSQRPGLGGYDQSQALTFVWVGQALLMALAIMGGGLEVELQSRIRSGDVAIDMYRPADLQTWWAAADAGRAGYHLLARGLLPMAAGALAFPLALPLDPLRWAAFLLSTALAFLVSIAIRYMVGLTAFWLMDGAGINMAASLCSVFFSGMLLPLTVFPGSFGEAVRWLPWSSVLQVPADVLLGRHTGAGLLAAFAFQAGWAVVLLLAGRAVQAAATRKVVVQGG
ncbi:ABC transporter permease [Streptomyces aidingensis]|uniref:ABC-2 type transport system permease protein n=1 Tax=Streptomyces aidingensis TaxID=910347 RepID=A0A1I1T9C0_9ACTN|nr:ABC-2 family transporter protein [Streptomyces aidingensis]SFD55224.1 ABC-2 type transport system permease protein [Streptomyces aidingensis]